MMKNVADTDICNCMYLEIHAHVHQINVLSCLFLYYNVVITSSIYRQVL